MLFDLNIVTFLYIGGYALSSDYCLSDGGDRSVSEVEVKGIERRFRVGILFKTTVIFVISILVVALFSLISTMLERRQYETQMFEKGYEPITKEVANIVSSLVDNYTANAVFQFLKSKYKSDFIAYIKIIGEDHLFLLSTDVEEEQGYSTDPRDYILVEELLYNGKGIISDEIRYRGEMVQDVGVRIESDRGEFVLKIGYYRPVMSTVPILSIVGLSAALLSLTFFYVLIRQTVKPIKRLTEDVQKIGRASTPSGGALDADISGIDRIDEIGGLSRAFKYMLSEIKKHQDELKESERLAVVGRSTWRIAHNISNLLNPIDTFAAEIRERTLKGGTSDLRLERALDGIDRHLGLVKKDISRMRRAVPDEPRKEPYSIPTLIDASLNRIPRPENIQVHKEYSKDVSPIEVDPEQMVDVFSNIVLNAYQAMEDGGSLSIDIKGHNSRSAEIKFSDTGIGIPEEKIRDIFNFFTTDKKGGMGIGLPGSLEVVKKHGGAIDVQSQVRAGTTFIVKLPVTDK